MVTDTRTGYESHPMTESRHPLGRLVAQLQDRHGPVTIYQKGRHRFLTFGNSVEQSCIDMSTPYRLEHVYTQAMMLGLVLKPDAASALLLGLGGGSLALALGHARPRLRIDAVEYRQAVIDAALTHLQLDGQPHLRLHCTDAIDFITSDHRHYDLIMLDLYLAEGVHPAQTQAQFLKDCRTRLRPGGIVLANQWCSEFRDSRHANANLREAFDDRVLYLHVQGGNTIAFGFQDELPQLKRDRFFELAQQLGLKLEIPLHKLARNFWRQNAEPLQIGRFARR